MAIEGKGQGRARNRSGRGTVSLVFVSVLLVGGGCHVDSKDGYHFGVTAGSAGIDDEEAGKSGGSAHAAAGHSGAGAHSGAGTDDAGGAVDLEGGRAGAGAEAGVDTTPGGGTDGSGTAGSGAAGRSTDGGVAGVAGTGGDVTTVDPCAQLKCQHGVCAVTGNAAQCSCIAGYSGALCETNANDCVGNQCQNNATCVDQVAGYACTCATGFAGDHCEKKVSSCADAPCAHSATCTDTATSYTCACPATYTGTNCTTDVDECTPVSPCVHGSCSNTTGSYTCSCTTGYQGKNCDQDSNECTPVSPCLHGTCANTTGSYTCSCATGYQGKNCDQDINECTTSNPCVHGTCSNTAGAYSCNCAGTGYQGKNCDQNVDDCAAKPCLNSGKCTDLVNDYSCACTSNFFGKTCSSARFRGVGIPAAAPDGFEVRASSTNPSTPVVLVGTGYKYSTNSTFAMRWSDATGFQLLSDTSGSSVNAVSGDGLVSVGVIAGTKPGIRWLASNNTNQGIGLGLGADSTQPNGTDAVGNSLAGTATYNPSSPYTRAFRWAADAPYAEIATNGSIGAGMSGDGLFMVGSYPVLLGNGATRLHGFLWSYSTKVIQDLGVPAGGSWDTSNALATNRTGTVVIGTLSANQGAATGAFRWENGVMVDLGFVAQGTSASALSDDGATVVGCASNGSGWIWDKTNGIRVLSSVLTATGADLSGWSGLCPVSISTDGKRIAGWGTGFSSSTWIATLP